MAYSKHYPKNLTAPIHIHRPAFAPGQPGHDHRHWPLGNPLHAAHHPARQAARKGIGNLAFKYMPIAHGYGASQHPGSASKFSPGRRWNWLQPFRPGYGYSPQPDGQGYSQPDGGAPAQAPEAAQAPPSQWVAWAQSCLAQTVGSWVPQSGTMGKATRHAIRTFQQQQQLPASGMLDAATVNALQTACGGQGMPSASPAPPPAPAQVSAPPPPGDDIAAATAAASASAAPPPPPDAPAPPSPSGVAQPDPPSGEFYLGGGGGWRSRRRWGSGFNFAQIPQPASYDDSEVFRGGGGRERLRRSWGSGMGRPQPPDEGDGGRPLPPRRRW